MIPFRFRHPFLWIGLLVVSLPLPAAPPSNDRCNNAAVLFLDSLPLQEVGSTLEAGDHGRSVGCPAQAGGKDVVYQFSLTQTTSLSISTDGSVFDTVLSVWSACSNGNLSGEVACNDDFDGISSRVDLYQAPPGTYYILLDGFDGSQSGTFVLTLSPPSPPPNDACSGAQPILLNSTVYGTTLGADNSQQQFCGAKLTNGPEVFYTFTSPDGADVRVDTLGSDLDTVITFRQVSCVGSVLACNDDFGGTKQSQITIGGLLPDFTYYIQVDSDESEAGTFRLNLNEVQPPPANDSCEAAQLAAAPSEQFGSTLFAENDSSSPTHGGAGPDVVFRITLAQATHLVLDTLGSEFDTVLYIRSGSCSGAEIGGNDDALGRRTSRVVLSSLSAGNYFVFVDGKSVAERGNFRLSIGVGTPPPNDSCESATQIQVPSVQTGSIRFAQDNTNVFESGCESTGLDVVFRFTLDSPRQLLFSTLGSEYDTVLYLLPDDCGSGEVLACNDDGAGAFGVASFIDDFRTNPLPQGSYRLFLDSNEVSDGNYTLQVLDLSTPTPVPSRTPTPSTSATPTRSSTRTRTNSATVTETGTLSHTVTVTSTPTSTPTLGMTPTPSRTQSATQTRTPTYSRTSTPTASPQPTVTETTPVTVTPSATSTGSRTHTPSASLTRTRTFPPTATVTQTQSATSEPSATSTPTPSSENSPTVTFTQSATGEPTFTPTSEETVTVTPDLSESPTHTASTTESETRAVTETPTETPPVSPTETTQPTETSVFPSETSTPTGPPSPDLNGDHRVGPADLLLFLTEWKAPAGGQTSRADFNEDGAVDEADLQFLALAWQRVQQSR